MLNFSQPISLSLFFYMCMCVFFKKILPSGDSLRSQINFQKLCPDEVHRVQNNLCIIYLTVTYNVIIKKMLSYFIPDSFVQFQRIQRFIPNEVPREFSF